MRMATSLLSFCLVAGALALPGCCSWCRPCPDAEIGGYQPTANPPASYPGVVEIYRDAGNTLVGYVSTDPDAANTSWWLLSSGEEPPVIPQSTGAPGNKVVWQLLNQTRMNGQMLCQNYKGYLENPRLWKVQRGAPVLCPTQ